MYVSKHASLGSWVGTWKTFASLCCVALAGCEASSESLGNATSFVVDTSGDSAWTTWTCTGDPCPWGDSTSNHAIAWPSSASPVGARLGYTASPAPYLPASAANGVTISIEFGSANVFAGEPLGSSHHYLATVAPGQSYDVQGLAEGEVLSVQSDNSFGYRVTATPSDDPPADPPPDAGTAPDAETPPDGTPPGDALASQVAIWTCTGSPCPWGDSLSGHAVVWPDAEYAVSTRLGYSVSAGVYLTAAAANGADISIVSGTAGAYAGLPGGASHRWLATIEAGDTFHVAGLADGEVFSVQADVPFTYRAVLPTPSDDDPGDDPDPGEVVQSTRAFWRCNTPECTSSDWTGAVIAWPASAAYQSNGRSGEMSRSVFSEDGTPLYPYMGAWAQGCKVTAVSGTVLVIEWQRGTDSWRETWLGQGQSHVIDLVSPEDGAMIETYEGSPGFSAALSDCTPQPLQP